MIAPVLDTVVVYGGCANSHPAIAHSCGRNCVRVLCDDGSDCAGALHGEEEEPRYDETQTGDREHDD